MLYMGKDATPKTTPAHHHRLAGIPHFNASIYSKPLITKLISNIVHIIQESLSIYKNAVNFLFERQIFDT